MPLILDKVCSMLHGTGLSLGFWELAADAAVHTYNCTPTRVLGWRTPHELWSVGHVPDVSYFRVFGCKAYVHVPEDKRQKLDPRSIEMTLVGYEPGSKGYRLWNSNTRAIVLSRDVTFDESSFPAKASSALSAPPSQPLVLEGPVTLHHPECEPRGPEPPQESPAPPRAIPAPPRTPPNPTVPPTRESTIFHTPPSHPPASSPPACPRATRVWRDPPTWPHSSLPGPSFGPAEGPPPTEPRRLRENPPRNPRYYGEDNAEHNPMTG